MLVVLSQLLIGRVPSHCGARITLVMPILILLPGVVRDSKVLWKWLFRRVVEIELVAYGQVELCLISKCMLMLWISKKSLHR